MADRNKADSLPMVVTGKDEEDCSIAVPTERPAKRSSPNRIFRDRIYTSRVLILPGGRSLQIAKRCVVIAADDAKALAHLQAHVDFEPLQE